MSHAKRVLEDLWRGAPRGGRVLGDVTLSGLPEAARRYLGAAIGPDAPLAEAVRLRMHGEIRLKGWCPFRAEQVIRSDGAMIWRATVRMGGLPVMGYDRLIEGRGALDWRILGLIPVMRRAGPDITRSAIGRALGERVWLPSALVPPDAAWSEAGEGTVTVTVTAWDETVPLTLRIGEDGAPTALSFPRWGDPDGTGFRWEQFGGRVEEMAWHGGYWIPSRLVVGWFFDQPRFEDDGAFFRCEIDHAEYR